MESPVQDVPMDARARSSTAYLDSSLERDCSSDRRNSQLARESPTHMLSVSISGDDSAASASWRGSYRESHEAADSSAPGNPSRARQIRAIVPATESVGRISGRRWLR